MLFIFKFLRFAGWHYAKHDGGGDDGDDEDDRKSFLSALPVRGAAAGQIGFISTQTDAGRGRERGPEKGCERKRTAQSGCCLESMTYLPLWLPFPPHTHTHTHRDRSPHPTGWLSVEHLDDTSVLCFSTPKMLHPQFAMEKRKKKRRAADHAPENPSTSGP